MKVASPLRASIHESSHAVDCFIQQKEALLSAHTHTQQHNCNAAIDAYLTSIEFSIRLMRQHFFNSDTVSRRDVKRSINYVYNALQSITSLHRQLDDRSSSHGTDNAPNELRRVPSSGSRALATSASQLFRGLSRTLVHRSKQNKITPTLVHETPSNRAEGVASLSATWLEKKSDSMPRAHHGSFSGAPDFSMVQRRRALPTPHLLPTTFTSPADSETAALWGSYRTSHSLLDEEDGNLELVSGGDAQEVACSQAQIPIFCTDGFFMEHYYVAAQVPPFEATGWYEGYLSLSADGKHQRLQQLATSVFQKGCSRATRVVRAFLPLLVPPRSMAECANIANSVHLFVDAFSLFITRRSTQNITGFAEVKLLRNLFKSVINNQIDHHILAMWRNVYAAEDDRLHRIVLNVHRELCSTSSEPKACNSEKEDKDVDNINEYSGWCSVFPLATSALRCLDTVYSRCKAIQTIVRAFESIHADQMSPTRGANPGDDSIQGADEFLPCVFEVFFAAKLKYAWSTMSFLNDMTQHTSLKPEQGYALATFMSVVTFLADAKEDQIHTVARASAVPRISEKISSSEVHPECPTAKSDLLEISKRNAGKSTSLVEKPESVFDLDALTDSSNTSSES